MDPRRVARPLVTLAPEDLAVIVLFAAAVMFIGFRASRRMGGAADFLLAGRSLTLPVFVMTLVSTWYGGILGVGEFSYLYGLSNWFIQGFPYYIFSALFAFFLAERIHRAGTATIPDKLEASYGRTTALLGAVLTFLLMTPAPYILMLGILVQLVTGWGLLVCLIVGTIASVAYLLTGGLKADVATDVFEFGVMFLGFAVIIPFAALRFGGPSFLGSHLPPLHLTIHGGHPAAYIIVWFFIALWTFVDPSFHQRCAAARSGSVARRGILWAIPFWFVFDALTATAGLYARAIVPGLDQPVMAYPALAEAVLPPVAKGVFYAGMLATILSTLNTLALVSGTTLGRDIVGRWRGNPGEGMGAVRWGIVGAAVLSIAFAWAIPSVIRLWYSIGTAVIPGLLLPLVTSYYERWKAPASWTLASMAAGWLISTGWLLASLDSGEILPLWGIEPMYPGLVASVAIWAAGRLEGIPARGGPGSGPTTI
jgi:SSS family solute:Na+ symporter